MKIVNKPPVEKKLAEKYILIAANGTFKKDVPLEKLMELTTTEAYSIEQKKELFTAAIPMNHSNPEMEATKFVSIFKEIAKIEKEIDPTVDCLKMFKKYMLNDVRDVILTVLRDGLLYEDNNRKLGNKVSKLLREYRSIEFETSHTLTCRSKIGMKFDV